MEWLLLISIGIVLFLAYRLNRLHDTLQGVTVRLNHREQIIQQLEKRISDFEQDNQQSKAFFETVSNVAFDMVLLLDEDLNIIAHNKASETFFPHINPLGEHLSQVIESQDLLDIASRALEESVSLEDQITIDDRHYRVHTQLSHYHHQHRFLGIALQDITRLVQLNRARRDMVANISHELRTPIANIKLNIESLFHERDKPKRKDSIETLKAISSETDTLQWLVQELLDLSMIESGQAILKMVDTSLNDLVIEAIRRLEDQLEIKDLRIANHVPEKMTVLCDPDHIRRVIVNLIHNAMKWSPKKEVISVHANPADDKVIISVLDNGPGVSPEQSERIFERFYQVDESRTGSEGSGLGLAICKHIVEAHGGTIWAAGNTSGSGGQFRFTLIRSIVDEDTPDMIPAEDEAVIPD